MQRLVVFLFLLACGDVVDVAPGDAGNSLDAGDGRGALGQPCFENGTCQSGLECNDSMVCIMQPACENAYTLFLNRQGGRYSPGENEDAIENVSSLVQGEAIVLEAATDAEIAWEDTVQEVRTALAPFDLRIVTEDPGEVAHLEVVFTISDSSVVVEGLSQRLTLARQSCGDRRSAVAFVFVEAANEFGATPWVLATQAVGGMIGLELTAGCGDVTAFNLQCTDYDVLDEIVEKQCSQNLQICLCPGGFQNSFEILQSYFGDNSCN